MERVNVDKVLNVLRQHYGTPGIGILELEFNQAFEDCFVINRGLQAMISSIMILRDFVAAGLGHGKINQHTGPLFALSMRYDHAIGLAVAHSARLEVGMKDLEQWATDVLEREMGKSPFTAKVLKDHFYHLIINYRDMYRALAESYYQIYKDANVPLDAYFERIGLKEYNLIFSKENNT